MTSNNSAEFRRLIQPFQGRNSDRLPWVVAVTLVVMVLIPAWGEAQVNPFPSHEVEVKVNSGDHFNRGSQPQVVWTGTVEVNKAEWIRLNFRFLVLANDPTSGTSSQLRITSLQDKAVQVLDSKSARQWRNTSAYFNGNAVQLELIAWPNGRMNRVVVDRVTAGEVPVPQESICDSVDDRVLSTDPRVGRTVPGGCTAWLFNDRKHCMLTAGHCASSTQVIEFNVPLSNANGSYNHPGPEHQYVVDPASMQFVSAGIGNDWCYFGCFANSNTGLTAFQAQGSSFTLAFPPAVSAGDQIRITGHGTTSSPVNPAWNGAQKTQVGPYSLLSGTQLGYRTDTTGGNSGSPVIFENNGNAIGIHTHGGCSTGGSGNNWGTGANNSGFQQALNNPLGICQAALGFEFPNGRPQLISPAGGTTMRVVVVDEGEEPQAGTGMLHYDPGGGFQSVPMNQVSPNVYDAVFPPSPCGSVVKYYVSANSISGLPFTDPAGAPSSFYTVVSANGVDTLFADNFETNQGWTVIGNASTGHWERGIPAGGGSRGDPPTDADGSGQCYVTENAAGDSDVDGGNTILTSPVMDASVNGNQQAFLSYHRWYSNDFGSAPMEDIFVVEISNNGGSSWVNLETVGPTGTEVSGGWFYKSFRISDYLLPTNQMRVRFIASDFGSGSVVEAGVDGVQIDVVTCSEQVLPDSKKLPDGVEVAGQLSDLFDSDDQYLQLDPTPTQNLLKQKVHLILQSSTASLDPSDFRFQLESKMLGGPAGDVIQIIELQNYQTNQLETIDSRAVSNTDQIIQVAPGGDLSRFVHPVNGEITASITWKSESFTGSPFTWSVDVDQTVWIVSD